MPTQAATLQSADGQQVPLLGVSAKGQLSGLLFELTVEQRYANRGSTNIEAVYTFPLPHGAQLLHLEVELGGRTLQGVVVERKDAEAQYEEAIDKGDTAIMLERAGSGLYTLNLGNLMAGEHATIRYRYAQLQRFVQGSVRVTVPTVIAPRYGDSGQDGMAPHQVPSHDLTADYPFALELVLEGAISQGTLASPTHAMAMQRSADGVRVTLDTPAALDRDFVLTIAGLARQSLSSVARDGDGYVALVSICPDLPAATDVLPLRVKIALDCSGSMGGDSIDAARRALHRVLENLTPADRFSFSRFGSNVVHDVPTLTSADAGAIAAAAKLLGEVDANMGGTEMEAALREVFAISGADGAADVLLITDGDIWGVDALVATARAARQRVFAIGVGSAATDSVLRQLAEATGGACELVAAGEDAEAAIVRMFARLRAPRYGSAEIVWPVAPDWVTALPSALFGSETLHAYAGFSSAPVGAVTLFVDGGAAGAASSVDLAAPRADATLPRMAAAVRAAAAGADERLALALQYSLITDRTNLLVVHERASGEKATQLPELRTVSQMMPAGWGGMGKVMRRSLSSMSVHDRACYVRADRGIPETIDGFLHALARECDTPGSAGVPTSLAELHVLGLPPSVITVLEALVAESHGEATVVQTLLRHLEKRARELGLPRQLRRLMRGAAGGKTGDAVLQTRIAEAVGAAEEAQRLAPRSALEILDAMPEIGSPMPF